MDIPTAVVIFLSFIIVPYLLYYLFVLTCVIFGSILGLVYTAWLGLMAVINKLTRSL